ncbi:MAG: bacteriophage abortive infection AbiH family protein [Lachnospiraceae bacterium]|nr:bacteriophage abortive infection AbiH family protein [Lachnospiraceae bacterium]
MIGNILYVIGNGFDRHHGLKTDVDSFLNILDNKKIYPEMYNAIEFFDNYGVDWNEYENALSKMELDVFDEDYIVAPDYMSDRESDRDGGIENMRLCLKSISEAIMDSLTEMVENANQDLNSTSCKIKNIFREGDVILSFNYTSTIERLYELPENIKILHIHGYYEDNDELIFGYKNGDRDRIYKEKHFNESAINSLEEKIKQTKKREDFTEKEKENIIDLYEEEINELTRDRDYYIDEQREQIIDFYRGWGKNFQLQQLKKFLKNCGDIDIVRVMGHSMAEVDSEYMEMIEKELNPRVWYISQFKGYPLQEDLRQYSFYSKIKFYELNDLN